MKFSRLTIVAPRSPSRRATYAPAKPPPRISTPPCASRSIGSLYLRPDGRGASCWSGLELGEPAAEKVALDVTRGKLERPCVRGGRLARAPEAAQQVGPRRVQEVVAVEPLDRVHQREALLEPFRHRDRDRAVQVDDGRRRQLGEAAVEERDLPPVGRLLRVEG